MNADLFRQQLVAPFAVLLELVPPPRCDDPALAVELAGMPCVLVEHERSPAKECQPVGALHIHLALIDADGDELLCVERVCEHLEAHHLRPANCHPLGQRRLHSNSPADQALQQALFRLQEEAGVAGTEQLGHTQRPILLSRTPVCAQADEAVVVLAALEAGSAKLGVTT